MSRQLPADVLEGALPWIERNLAHFDPFKDGELSGLCEIPLAELGILTLAAVRCSGRVDRAPVMRFLDALEAAYRDPRYEERPFREPETLVSHLIVAAALVHAGRVDVSSYQSSVARLVRASTLTAPALPPHGMMELRHALDLAGVEHSLPSYRRLYFSTLPSRRVNPIFVAASEAYILTHVIFYAADLGYRRPVGLAERDRVRLGRLVEQLLGMHIVAGNWDLTAELILSARCLDHASAFADLGWECIAGAQRPDGAVPGPRNHPSGDTPLTPEEDVATCYHTTLVSSLAALAAINERVLAPAPR